MKILLTNYSLGWLGGTQTWVKTMYDYLIKEGHQVDLFAGDNDYSLLPQSSRLGDDYDLALINHNTCLSALEGIKIKKRVFTSHGVIPELEQPIRGADVYVSVSEEVQENLKKQGFNSLLIRNPIDLDVYRPTRPINHKLTKVLFLSNYQGKALEVVTKAVDLIKGVQLEVLGKNKQTSNVVEVINNADLVIALGRTAYEAMACNRNVIIYDYNGADGFVNHQTIYEYRENNCSGRCKKRIITAEDLVSLINMYNPQLELRWYIKDHHDVKKIATEYLNIWYNKN